MNGGMRKRHTGHTGGHGAGQGGRRPYQKYGKPQHGGHGGGNYGQPRVRKNYPALREKYLNQAKDALSAGDRVLAEYYLQHADHYYRMQMEYQEQRARWQEQNQNQEIQAENDLPEDDEPDVDIPNNSNVLPAFLTRKTGTKQEDGEDKAPPVQEWEDEAR